MPGTVTLATLLTEVRQRADMENTDFVSDSEITRYIQQSAGELLDILLENGDMEHFLRSGSFQTVAGTSLYALTTMDVYRILGVDILWNNKIEPLNKFAFHNRNAFNYVTGWVSPATVAYTPSGRNAAGQFQLSFIPTPSAVHSVVVYYIPVPTLIDSGSNPLQGLSGWDEYVVVDAAMKCLEKEDSDVAHLQARKMQLIDRLKTASRKIDSGEPSVTADVYAAAYPLYPYLPMP